MRNHVIILHLRHGRTDN